MTIHHLTKEDIEELKQILPKSEWANILRTVIDNADDPNYPTDQELYNIIQAYGWYKSPSGWTMQDAVKSRPVQQAFLKNEPLPTKIRNMSPHRYEDIKNLDLLLSKSTIPEGLENTPLYRGIRLSFGTALIKSGKKPGDTIRDPRYQSFSINPGTAMYHTSVSQYGDKDAMAKGFETEFDPDDPIFKFKRKKKVLLEHYPRAGESGYYSGGDDPELEVIYPRNKIWKITNIRDEDVTFGIRSGDDPIEGKQNVRIYTVERKKKKIKPVVKRTASKIKPKPKKTIINLNGLNDLLFKPKHKITKKKSCGYK